MQTTNCSDDPVGYVYPLRSVDPTPTLVTVTPRSPHIGWVSCGRAVTVPRIHITRIYVTLR